MGSRGQLAVFAAACAALLLLSASAGAAGGGAPSAIRSSANLRLRATNAWYGDGRIPLDSRRGPFSPAYERFLARTAARERLASRATPRATSPAWVNLGPTKANFATNGVTLDVTDSGRPRSIIVHGSTIYVASAMGGVWKSTDSGSTWAPITDGEPTLSDGSLAMDPNNSSILYLGFGDPFDGFGIGLVKSTDGGATWSSPVSLGNETTIPDIVVDPSDSSIVLAATDDGLYRSTNAGASFSKVSIATGDVGAPKVWSIAPTATHHFVLSLEGNPNAAPGSSTDGQIWTSTDDGATWSKATGVTSSSGIDRITVASAPSSPSTVYALAADPNGDLADIFKSTNGGASWTGLNVAATPFLNENSETQSVGQLFNTQGWYDQFVAVDPTDANTVYFGGSLLIAKTTDGGSTFSEISNWLGQFGLPYVHADCHAATFDANGNLYVGTDGGIAKTTDGGLTFDGSLNVGLVDQLVYSVGSSPAATSAVIGGFQDLGTRLREGSTSTFDQVIGGDGFGSDINRSDGTQMLGSLYYDQIYKSTTSGVSWAPAMVGISEANNGNAAPFLTKIVPWRGDPAGNTMYTFSNTKVYKTTNYATSWSALPTAVVSSGVLRNVGAAASNSNVVGAVASGGRVFISQNAGSSWTQSTPPNNQLSLSYISFDPGNASTVYVASVSPTQNASHLWKSTDAGAHWTSIDGYGGSANGFPTGVPVNIVTVDPLNSSTVYAGTQLGLYRSTDGGTTWSLFGTGMPLVSVDDLYIAPDDSVIRAASYGRGFWQLQSQNGGTSHTLSVTKGGSGAGTVTSNPAGIDCGATCSASFTDGTQVTLTATAATGSVFSGWSGGGCSGTSTCHVTVNADTTVTANFTATHTLTVQRTGTGSGSVTSSPAGIDCGSACAASFAGGTQVTLTATPVAGSVFSGWSGGGCSGTSTCHVTVNADTTVTANFAATHTLTVQEAGTGSGSVTSSPAGIDCGSACAASFAGGTQVTLTATPDAGSAFSGWSGGGCSGTGTCHVTVASDTTVTATFATVPSQCVVPNVKGKSLARAKSAIRAAHCAVGKVKKAASKKVRKGHVISQSPKAGKHLPDGSKVKLVVSKGKR